MILRLLLHGFANLELQKYPFVLVKVLQILVKISQSLSNVTPILCHQVKINKTVNTNHQSVEFIDLCWMVVSQCNRECDQDNPPKVPHLLPLSLHDLAKGLVGCCKS